MTGIQAALLWLSMLAFAWQVLKVSHIHAFISKGGSVTVKDSFYLMGLGTLVVQWLFIVSLTRGW